MYRTAYDTEFDLRNMIYEHLTTLSFGFYDRVQSGQLISRANSDIRSVQMYTTFAPLILVQCSIGVIAFGFMVYYSPLLPLVALAMMPLLYRVGVRMRKQMFPISWVIQARLAGVATVVDENVNGVRVVKSFAQEQAELRKLADAAKKVEWAYIKDADIRGHFTPWVQNLPQIGLALVLGIGGWLVINGSLDHRRDPRLQPLLRDAPGAVHDARPARDDGAAREGKRRAHLRDPRRAPATSPSALTRSTSRPSKGASRSDTSTSPTSDGSPILDGPDVRGRARRVGRLVGRDRHGEVDRRAAAHTLLRRERWCRGGRRP